MRHNAALHRALACAVLASGLLFGVAAPAAGQGASPVAAAAARVPQPLIEPARSGPCVEDPAFMRRNHMDLLRHDRDDTLRRGIRSTRHSLKACIACHASTASNSVSANSGNFCQSCHIYAAVQIDCFECHASTPAAPAVHARLAVPVLATPGSAIGAPVLARQQRGQP